MNASVRRCSTSRTNCLTLVTCCSQNFPSSAQLSSFLTRLNQFLHFPVVFHIHISILTTALEYTIICCQQATPVFQNTKYSLCIHRGSTKSKVNHNIIGRFSKRHNSFQKINRYFFNLWGFMKTLIFTSIVQNRTELKYKSKQRGRSINI